VGGRVGDGQLGVDVPLLGVDGVDFYSFDVVSGLAEGVGPCCTHAVPMLVG
jgi:hypothetical protein